MVLTNLSRSAGVYSLPSVGRSLPMVMAYTAEIALFFCDSMRMYLVSSPARMPSTQAGIRPSVRSDSLWLPSRSARSLVWILESRRWCQRHRRTSRSHGPGRVGKCGRLRSSWLTRFLALSRSIGEPEYAVAFHSHQMRIPIDPGIEAVRFNLHGVNVDYRHGWPLLGQLLHVSYQPAHSFNLDDGFHCFRKAAPVLPELHGLDSPFTYDHG